MSNPMFAKRHYEALATFIQELDRSVPLTEFSVSNQLARMFEADNPRFDRARFKDACIPGANVRKRTK